MPFTAKAPSIHFALRGVAIIAESTQPQHAQLTPCTVFLTGVWRGLPGTLTAATLQLREEHAWVSLRIPATQQEAEISPGPLVTGRYGLQVENW
jgi:hypothetical protein